MEGSLRCSANYVPLSPISFLERAAIVYSDQTSVIFGDISYTWSQTHQRCIKLASSISQLIAPLDVVCVLAPNVPATYELHFAVPMSGAVLCTLNTYHHSEMISTLLKHTDAKLLFVHHQFLHTAHAALQILSKTTSNLPRLVLIDNDTTNNNSFPPETLTFEDLISKGNLDFEVRKPMDELDPITISYTSGTTANPKSVIYSHRGAYLNSLVSIIINEMMSKPVYLWSVPMFHCNGWCIPWSIAAQGGTNICLTSVTAEAIFDNILKHKVTHMGGAPTVLNMIINSPPQLLPEKVEVMTGGAAPPPDVILKMEELGFKVTHAYGCTEAYGPAAVNTWKQEWDNLTREEQAKLKTRQGVRHVGMEDLDVKDPKTMISVAADGKTIGEVMFRGNSVMSGYLKELKATEEAFEGGWFRSGDLGVKHPDGYIEVKDRSKDMIVCGGDMISSIQLEAVIFSHPSVFEAAVVGRPHDHMGETPCAFVKLKEGCSGTTEDEIIQFCLNRLPPFMSPPITVVFADLPKTSTGKTQKYVLRDRAKAMFADKS